MPVSQLVDDTPFCITIKRGVGLLTYLLTNKQGSNIPVDLDYLAYSTSSGATSRVTSRVTSGVTPGATGAGRGGGGDRRGMLQARMYNANGPRSCRWSQSLSQC